MTVTNPIQYTSRTFTSIISDINSDNDLVDKPDWFKRIIAGVADMLDMNMNAVANQSFLRTAFTRQAVSDLLALIDYQLTPHTTCEGTQIFYVSRSASLPVTITASNLVALSQSTVSVSSKRFESSSSKTHTDLEESFTCNSTTNQLLIAGTYISGDLVRVRSTATLPTAVDGDLSSSTDYYVIYVDSTHIKLARSLALAYAGTPIDLTGTGTGTLYIKRWSFSATLTQKTTVSDSILGVANETAEFQTFDIPDNFILEDSITLTINGDTWTRVDSFINSISTDKHFRLLYKKDGASYVQFGDGTHGLIPSAFTVYADYSYGGGADSNISVTNRITTYAGSDTNITGTSNPSEYTGGANEESLEVAKINAPMLLKSRDRFITVDDGEALALAYGGCSIVQVNVNTYGLLSCQVVAVPNGGGVLGTDYKNALQAYLITKTILDSIDVRVVSPTYVVVDVTSAVKVLSGYAYASVNPFFKLAWRLLFTEITQEILNDYGQNGIASAVAIINTKWSTSFTVADYPQIQRLLDNVEPTAFGKVFQESATLAFINTYVEGVDYLTTTLSFPVTLTSSEISQAGTMTITEI